MVYVSKKPKHKNLQKNKSKKANNYYLLCLNSCVILIRTLLVIRLLGDGAAIFDFVINCSCMIVFSLLDSSMSFTIRTVGNIK